jgi:hypothetical protein
MAFSGFAQQTNQSFSHGRILSADELSRREIMARLQKIPECRAYNEKFVSAISAKTSALDASSSPHDTMILATVKFHQDGNVSDITISGNTNAPIAQLCIKAIKDCSPFPKWPDKMRSIAGKEYLEIHFNFGFNMTGPSEN